MVIDQSIIIFPRSLGRCPSVQTLKVPCFWNEGSSGADVGPVVPPETFGDHFLQPAAEPAVVMSSLVTLAM